MDSPPPNLENPAHAASPLRRALLALVRWFDTEAEPAARHEGERRIDWLRVLPFLGMHLACLGLIWVGFSWFAFWTALVLYAVRMFAITGFYHRYFSHKAFKTSRPVQFLFALIGSTSVQRGPLWWAAHHRNHHRHSDTEHDPHSARVGGFFWSHMGWFLTERGFRTDRSVIGGWLERAHPELGTNGPQLLIWGFFVSTVVLFHATVTINSLAHKLGRRRYATGDDSRNNWWLALITFGEGWHNNHHHFPGSARQGFYWWEIDFTYYMLRLLALFRIVWDLKPVPEQLRRSG
jgi:stearoyl-CoA desaturase (delta-9 desaturase)